MQIELKNIHKYYGKIKANDGISSVFNGGTIHGILGENGAGKSTLMKILSGYAKMTKGAVFINNSEAFLPTPDQAAKQGISMLYQEPMDFPQLSVLENFMAGQHGKAVFRTKDQKKRLKDLCRRFGFALDNDAKVCDLTIGERQQLELLRLLSIGVQVLILDEPTTGISNRQKEVLFSALRTLSDEGKIVILVTHKLEDVNALCDHVTVLRNGKVSGELEKPFETNQLLSLMFGSPPELPSLSMVQGDTGNELLHLIQVSAAGGRAGLHQCNRTIYDNEIVALAGLEGSGQDVFLRVACGLTSPTKGSVFFKDMDMKRKKHHFFKRKGIGFLPGARIEEGLISGLNIKEHLSLFEKKRTLLLDIKEAARKSARIIEKFGIKGSPDSSVESLSGGNQQRLLFSFLPKSPKLLLLENPTRGLDVASVNFVWQKVQEFRDNQVGVVFSSTDLDEILFVADRILVFFEGRVVKDLRSDKTNIKELGRAIAGDFHDIIR